MQKNSTLRPVHIFLTYTIDAPDVSSCEGSGRSPTEMTTAKFTTYSWRIYEIKRLPHKP